MMPLSDEPKPNGRPPKLRDPESRAAFLKIIREGGSKQYACDCLRINRETFRREVRRDREFRMDIRQARAEGLMVHVRGAVDKDNSNYRQHHFMLERLDPERWAKKKPELVTHEQHLATTQQLIALVLSTIPSNLHPAIHSKVQAFLSGPIVNGETQSTPPPSSPDAISSP